jgi:hypothetical protein
MMLLTGNKCQVRVDPPRMPTWPALRLAPRRWLPPGGDVGELIQGWPRSTAALMTNDRPRALFLVDQMAVMPNGTLAPGTSREVCRAPQTWGHPARGCGSRGRYRRRLSGILRPGPPYVMAVPGADREPLMVCPRGIEPAGSSQDWRRSETGESEPARRPPGRAPSAPGVQAAGDRKGPVAVGLQA